MNFNIGMTGWLVVALLCICALVISYIIYDYAAKSGIKPANVNFWWKKGKK